MPAAAVPRMGGAPGLHAFDVHGVAEVLAVLGPRQPGSLTGDLARASTGPGRAVPLPLVSDDVNPLLFDGEGAVLDSRGLTLAR